MRIAKWIASAVGRFCDSAACRYALSAIRFAIDDQGNATATATDGRAVCIVRWRPEEVEEDPTKAGQAPATYLIDGKAISAVAKQATEEVELSGAKQIHAHSTTKHGDALLVVDAIDGRFPKTDRIFPRINKTSHVAVSVDAALLRKALDAAIDAHGRTREKRCVTLWIDRFEPEESIVVIASHHADHSLTMGLMPCASNGSEIDSAKHDIHFIDRAIVAEPDMNVVAQRADEWFSSTFGAPRNTEKPRKATA